MLQMATVLGQEGRVGINTENPKATLDIVGSKGVAETYAQGVIFPRFTTEDRAKFTNVVEGTMIYNTTKHCVEVYQLYNEELQWRCQCSCETPEPITDSTDGIASISIDGIESYFVSQYSTCYGWIVSATINDNTPISLLYTADKDGVFTERRYEGTFTSYNVNSTVLDTNKITLVIPAGEFRAGQGKIPAYLEVDGDGFFRTYNSGIHWTIELGGKTETVSILPIMETIIDDDECM